jgi:hypothetical protein
LLDLGAEATLMPRIRSIKPDALQHRKVGSLSDRAFRLWVALITQADDDGRVVADPEQLRVLGFGYHRDVTAEDVHLALAEIAKSGLIRLYTVRDVAYADFPSWRDHQRIDRPTPSKLPPPPGLRSTRTRRQVAEPSTSARGGSEGMGREGKGSRIGREGRESEGREAGDVSPAPPLVASAPDSRTGNGNSPRPTRGDCEPLSAVLERVVAKHPELQPPPATAGRGRP